MTHTTTALTDIVDCPLCRCPDYQPLYTTTVFASEAIGTLDIQISMCEQCGFSYQNPQLTQETLDRHYQHHSSGATFHLLNENSRHFKLLTERNTFIESHIPLEQRHVICDMGGGQGDLISSIQAPQNAQKILIEPSCAIDQFDDPQIHVINKKIEDLSPADCPQIDLLLCISVLEHLKNPADVLQALQSKMTEGGYLVLEVPNSLTPYLQLAEFYSYEHLNHFTEQTLQQCLTQSGFIVIATDQTPSIPNIRIIAKKSTTLNNKTLTVNALKQYQTNKKAFIEQAFHAINDDIINKSLSHFSIYGTGEHTRAILEQFHFIDKVEYFIDTDSKKWGTELYNKPIIGPHQISDIQHRTILISSHDFELEIAHTIREHDTTIHIITLYNNLSC